MKKTIKVFSFIGLMGLMLSMLASCSLFGGGSKAKCSYGSVQCYANYASNYYYLQAEIYNNGDGNASSVKVTYYYTDQGNLKKYTKSEYVGSISAGDSITWKSNNIYESSYGCGIVNYGISEVTWS